MSNETYECKICFDESNNINDFISPCCCTGSMLHVHKTCLNTWLLSRQGTKEYEKCSDCHCKFIRDEPNNIDDQINNKLTMTSLVGVTSSTVLLIFLMLCVGLSTVFCSIILILVYLFTIFYFANFNNNTAVWIAILILFAALYSGRKIKTFITDLWMIFIFMVGSFHFIDEGWDIVYRLIKKDSLVEKKVGMFDKFTNKFVMGII